MPKLNLTIEPREPFREFITAKQRWMTLVCHRRAGKTVAVIQRLIYCALTHKRKGMETAPLRFAYIAPTLSQAKDISFDYLVSFTSEIPGIVVNKSELSVTFPTGAQIRLYSGDNFERMRGLYMDGVCMDEADDIPPSAFQYVILPCLLDYKGWLVRMGTPKGKGVLYKAVCEAKERPRNRFCLLLKASQSGLIDEDDLEAIREEIGDDAYAQEMECDFNVARPGAIYAKEVDAARQSGRVCEFEPSQSHLVYTTWDLGAPENTVVVYTQKVDLTYRVIDCDFGLKMTTAERVSHMLSKGYNYGQHFLPHDGRSRGADGMSFDRKLREAGLANVQVLPNVGYNAEEKRIRHMKDLFSQMWFRKQTVDVEDGLLDALENYHNREEIRTGRITNVIVHDWSSHFADSFGYFGEALQTGMMMDSLTRRAVGRASAAFKG